MSFLKFITLTLLALTGIGVADPSEDLLAVAWPDRDVSAKSSPRGLLSPFKTESKDNK